MADRMKRRYLSEFLCHPPTECLCQMSNLLLTFSTRCTAGSSEREYTRFDFLCFQVGTIISPKNNELCRGLQQGTVTDGIESWDSWQKYPNRIVEVSDFTEDRVLEFLTWLIHQFAPIVCFKGSRKDYLNKFPLFPCRTVHTGQQIG